MEAKMNKVTAREFGKYFTGKAQAQAQWAVAIINRSIDEDGWVKGAARTVRAALTKFSTATKKDARWVDGLASARPYEHGVAEERAKPLRNALWTIGHHMYFGGPVDRVAEAAQILSDRSDLLTNDEKRALSMAKTFVASWLPVWAAVEFLDSLRPKPVFVFSTLSPTGARILLSGGYKPDTCRLPEFVYHRELDQATGKYECWTEIIWPAGTLHNKSRFFRGTANNLQCHACGHAIKNGFNWVPLAIDNGNGETHSFWVGRDCAKKLFGVDMKGDAQYKNVEGR